MIFNGYEFTISLRDAKRRGWFTGDVVEISIWFGLYLRFIPVIWFERKKA